MQSEIGRLTQFVHWPLLNRLHGEKYFKPGRESELQVNLVRHGNGRCPPLNSTYRANSGFCRIDRDFDGRSG